MSISSFGAFDTPWISMPPFDIEIGPTAGGQTEISGANGATSVGKHKPILTARFQFGPDNAIDSVSIRSPEFTLYEQNERIRRLVDSHPKWSDETAATALKDAGAKFGPSDRESLQRVLPTKALEPFIGSMQISSSEFRLRHQQKPNPVAELYWVVDASSSRDDGRSFRWEILLEPFEGRLIALTRVGPSQ